LKKQSETDLISETTGTSFTTYEQRRMVSAEYKKSCESANFSSLLGKCQHDIMD